MNSKALRKNRQGFTLVEIMVVVAIIGLLAAIAIPNFVKARENARLNVCIKNIKSIDEAKHMWGLDQAKGAGDTPTDAELFGPSAFIKIKPLCPSGGTYTIPSIGDTTTCSEGPTLGHSL